MKVLKTANRSNMEKLFQVLDLIVISIEHYKKTKKPLRDKYFKFAVGSAQTQNYWKSLGKTCVDFAIKSICSHRYEETAKLLWLLCQDMTVFDCFLHKAMMIILEGLLPEKDADVLILTNDLQYLRNINKKESQLEYIMYGLKNNIVSVQSKVEGVASKTKTTYLRKHPVVDPLFEAYHLYLRYTEQTNLTVGEFPESQLSMADDALNDAIAKFKLLIDVPGDWDVFVLKLIELLEIANRREETEAILFEYIEKNPYHLNGYLYLCEYLNCWDPLSDALIVNLQKLFHLWPSDTRTLLLAEKINNRSGDALQCLRIVFMFLDYPSNGKNLRAWIMLSEFLLKVKSKNLKDEKKTLKALWKSRCDSWNWMYFNPLQINSASKEEYELILCKASSLPYLQKDHEYLLAVMAKYPEMANRIE